MVSTTGEIFASTVLMKMVAGISGLDFPNLKLKLQTNGILAPKRWSKLGDMADRVESVTVTVDAAQAPTYEQLRRGAKWHQIQSAMSWLQERKRSHGVRLHTRMIVQRENFLEIEQFYHWSMAYDVDIVEYARIMDWQTFGDSFLYHDVFDPRHDLFLTAQKELAKVAKLSNVLLFGGLHTSG